MERKFVFPLTLGVFFVVAFASPGQTVPPGYDAASFARLGVGGRALGMAGAYVAVAEGPAAGYWNPAGLSGLDAFDVEGMYTNWLGADIHFQYVCAGGRLPIGEQRPTLRLGEHPITFGLTWLSVNIADIPYWDEQGGHGTFDAWSHLVLTSMSLELSQPPGLTIGGSLKVYHDQILEGKSLGFGVDVGGLWCGDVAGVPLRLGVCTTDVGTTKIRWYGTPGEPINYVPWVIRAGAAVELWDNKLLLAASYERGLDRSGFERLRIGAEARLAWLALRVGRDQPFSGQPGKWAAGAGIKAGDWLEFDYTLLFGALGNSGLIALEVSF